LLEARRRGDKIEPSSFETQLGAEAQRLAYESLFGSGEPPDREQVLDSLRALRKKRVEQELNRLAEAIKAAELEKDSAKSRELLTARVKLDKEFKSVTLPSKNLAQGGTK
jgi:formate dehydrogenase maturation protein FdhE